MCALESPLGSKRKCTASYSVHNNRRRHSFNHSNSRFSARSRNCSTTTTRSNAYLSDLAED